jgi:hypothetical protein
VARTEGDHLKGRLAMMKSDLLNVKVALGHSRAFVAILFSTVKDLVVVHEWESRIGIGWGSDAFHRNKISNLCRSRTTIARRSAATS